MKKSSKISVAVILILLHMVIFLALVRQQPKDESAKPVPTQTEKTDPAPESVFKPVPLPEPEPLVVESVARPETVNIVPISNGRVAVKTLQPRLQSGPGHLQRNRPSRRTREVFSKLVRSPYQSAIVVDAETGKILFEDRATSYAYPASVTKLMTMLVVLERVKAGSISLNDKVKITKEIAGIGGSEIYLDVRESGAFTVDDMLNALMIHSANDAARALAIHVAGSRDTFVDMMNQKARELGMNATVYHSEHGLPPGSGKQPDISTAHDIALLSMEALRHPETLRYTGTKLTWLPLSPARKEKFMLANRNALVGKDPYPGCDGLKTGYHGVGGWSLTATSQQGGKRVIAIALGCPDKTTRNSIVRKLLDKGFAALGQ